MLMVQCLLIGRMVSLSNPILPHHLILHYVISVRGYDHSVAYMFTSTFHSGAEIKLWMGAKSHKTPVI